MTHITLISTTHHLLAIDEQDRFYRIHTGKGLYYGLCQAEDLIYVAVRNSVKGYLAEDEREKERGSLLVFSDSLQYVDEVSPNFALRDLHGITAINDEIWLTCSRDNMVAIYNRQLNTWRRWYPSPNAGARDRDINHFNTIALLNNRLYVLAHNNGPSELFTFRYPDLQLECVSDIGNQSHDIFERDGQITVCSSGEGLLRSQKEWAFRALGYPRGIAFRRSSILLGISLHGTRDERQALPAVLRRYSLQWEFVTDYTLPGVGMVLDMLMVKCSPGIIQRLEPWNSVFSTGTSNAYEPRNTYLLGKPGVQVGRGKSEWHEPEGELRWTAATEARMDVYLNEDERAAMLIIEAFNAFPGSFDVVVEVANQSIGVLLWNGPGTITSDGLPIPASAKGLIEIKFIVPSLRRPSEWLQGSTDNRLLGIAIKKVVIVPTIDI